jgi:hypothetical protein
MNREQVNAKLCRKTKTAEEPGDGTELAGFGLVNYGISRGRSGRWDEL